MIFSVLADVILVLHFAFILFVVLGGALVMRWLWLAILHIPAVLWGAATEFLGLICPLTPLEISLRQQAGEAGYAGSFVGEYLLPLVYPGALTTTVQIWLGILVIAVNAGFYLFIWRRYKSRF